MIQLIENKRIIYTHKEIKFEWIGGLAIYFPNKLLPIKMQINNGILSWRLTRNVWLSVNQFKKIIKGES